MSQINEENPRENGKDFMWLEQFLRQEFISSQSDQKLN